MLSRVAFRSLRSGLRSGPRVSVVPHTGWRALSSEVDIKEFTLADIGEGIAEVELLQWFVEKGDTIKAFDKICEVQSDKATVEITSRYDGKIAAMHHEVGSIVKVGSVLVDIEAKGGAGAGAAKGGAAKLATGTAGELQVPLKVPSPNTKATSIKEFTLADIGEGIAEVELLQWFVELGQDIKAFDKICEVQSDKATVEITSRYDGKVVAMHHEIGGEVKVGSVLVDIEVKGGGGDNKGDQKGANTPAAAAAAAAPTAMQTQTPTPGFSREAGLPKSYNAPDPVNINGGKVLTTPAVRKVARERGIDLKSIIGTGPKGRILKEDVLRGPTRAALAAAPSSSAQPAKEQQQQQQQQQQPAAPTPVFRNSNTEDTVVPIRGVQRLMVKSMEAAREVQHLTLGEEICVDALVNTRTDLKKTAEAMGIKLTYMPLFIKAASLALAAYPSLNATTAPDMSSVTRHGAHNIGVAMDSPSGLVVPVIRDCQDRSVFEIAAELNRLQTAVMAGKVDSKDLQGGTFTLSNIGSVGGTFATPVVVVPQVAIGALCRFQTVAKYPEGMSTAQVIASGALPVPTTVMNVAWSADHRVVDGATVARFSNAWRGYIENPASMLAQLR